MGEAQALKKTQSVILAGVLAMSLGCGITAGAKAYADEGLQAGATELSTQIQVPTTIQREIFVGKTVKVALKDLTANQTGTWTIKDTTSLKKGFVDATIDENGVVTITGKKAGKAKILVEFTTDDYGMKGTTQFFIKVTGIAKGESANVKNANAAKNLKYTVTKNVTKDNSGAVKVVGALNKNAKKIVVPATVKIKKGDYPRTYKVRCIGSYAFKGMSNLKTLTIGKNVKHIGSKILKGTKVKTVTIKSELLTAKSKVKNCFAGSSVKTVKVPASKVKAYKKIFTKAKCGANVKVVAAA